MAWPLVARIGWWAATKIFARSASQSAARAATSTAGRQALSAANGLESAIQTAEMAQKLIEEAGAETGEISVVDVCASCQQEPEKPECEDKAKAIRVARNELEQRNLDLYIDKHNLFSNYYDVRHPHYGSWKGHIEQFENRQKRLRKLLAEYRAMGCPEDSKSDDADKWGSRQPVDMPENIRK